MSSSPTRSRSDSCFLVACTTVGVVVMAYGIVGFTQNAQFTTPWPTVRSLIVTLVVNDLLVLPLLLAAGALTTLLPPQIRPPLRAAMIVSAVVIAFAVWGSVGQSRDVQLGNPTVLPNNYVESILILLVPVRLLAVALTLILARGAKARPRP